jgi:hypothetical protein
VFLTVGILPYFEDLKRGTNKEIDPPLAGWAKRHFGDSFYKQVRWKLHPCGAKSKPGPGSLL